MSLVRACHCLLDIPYIDPATALGEEIDRNQELGGFKPSSYRVSGVPLPPGVAGPLNFAGPTKSFHTFVVTPSKSAQVELSLD